MLTGRNLRRTARLWSWGAMLSAPLFLVMGVLLLVGAGPGAQPPVEMARTGPAGSPVELPHRSGGSAVWGRGDVAGAACATHRSSGDTVARLDVGRVEGRPEAVEDAGGTGRWTLLAVTDGSVAAASVTCSGEGLTDVAVSADPAASADPGLGLRLVVLAPALFVLGWAVRRVARPRAAAPGPVAG